MTKHRTLKDALIGETVTVGDPIEVTVRGYELSIRKSEAENIHIH